MNARTQIFLLFCFIGLRIMAQCHYHNTSFNSSEKLNYEIYYNWGFIWLNAGEADFNTEKITYNNKPAIHIKSSGRTYDNFDWFYRVRDSFESIVDYETITPYYFSRTTSEGSYKVENNYTFNYENNTILSNTWNSKSQEKKQDSISLDKCTLDILSSVFACRTINFSSKQINDTIPLRMVVDGEIYSLFIRFLGKETIVNRDNRVFNCNKFSVMLVEGTIFSGGEDMFIWVTDDKNQIPVYVEAKILVGSVKAMVKNIVNARWPANYQVFNTSE